MKLLIISTLLSFSLFSYVNFLWPVSSDLTVTFLEVGQGDSILISTPHGRRVLIDGGPGANIVHALGKNESFWIRSLDLLVLTHSDLDHIEGFFKILDRYEIGAMLVNGETMSAPAFQALAKKADALQIPIISAQPDQDWKIDEGVFLDFITPALTKKLLATTNNSALLMRLTYGKTSLLFMSDAEKEEELALLQTDYDLHSQILKVGHHGSQTSTTEALLNAVKPQEAIISSGKMNSYDHPHLSTVLALDEAGIEWKNTKDKGTITIRSDGQKWY